MMGLALGEIPYIFGILEIPIETIPEADLRPFSCRAKKKGCTINAKIISWDRPRESPGQALDKIRFWAGKSYKH